MRILAILVLLVSTPVTAGDGDSKLADGLYCGDQNVMPISVHRNEIGIDGLACSRVALKAGRFRSRSCYANGGSIVEYDTDMVVRPDGSLVHDGVVFRRRAGPAPCPVG